MPSRPFPDLSARPDRSEAPAHRPLSDREFEALLADPSLDRRLTHQAHRMGVSGDELDDHLQEVRMRLWMRRHHYQPQRASFPTWSHGVARNRAREGWRKRARETRNIAALGQLRDIGEQDVSRRSFGELDESSLDLRACWAQLALGQRDVLELYYGLGLNTREIATLRGLGVEAIKTRLARARIRLRGWLEASSGAPPSPETLRNSPRRPATSPRPNRAVT